VAVEDWLAEELKLAEGEPAWHRLLARYPSVAAQFADARPIRAFAWMPRLAYRAAKAAGERWAMLPSAAAFIDPLFSTGIPLTLLGIERLARVLERGIGNTRLDDYVAATLDDADRTARFIAGSYAGFHQFPMFTAYSMFYFAAASFAEMARRLASSRAPRRFLCGDSIPFASALDQLSPAAGRAENFGDYANRVASAVAGWNVAGLCDSAKKNWYAVDLEDTVRGAAKLGLSEEQVRRSLEPLAGSLEPRA
jgi:FADH2 O2-dependent halogenase